MKRTSPQQTFGFTLIELVIVLSILSVLVLTSMKWPKTSIQLYAQAERLMKDLRYVQSLAMSRDELYGLQFFKHSYRIIRSNDPKNIMIDWPSSSNISQNECIFSHNIHLNFPSTLLQEGKLLFDGKGIPYNQEGPLQESVQIVLTQQPNKKNVLTAIIRIFPETGKIEQ